MLLCVKTHRRIGRLSRIVTKGAGGSGLPSSPFYCLDRGRCSGLCPLASLAVLTPSPLRSPSFPPLSDAIETLASLPWQAIASRSLEALLFALALCHALALRLWQQRGRLAPFLRSVAALLERLAASLPEPLSEASPRALLIESLEEAGERSASLAKASRSALLKRAARLGLL